MVRCKGCGEIFAVCAVPLCYQDKEWFADIGKWSKQGCQIEVGEFGKDSSFGCKCPPKEPEPSPQLSLF